MKTFPIARPAALAAALLVAACGLEKPDPASQAAAILHKRPSTYLDRLVALDDLAAREWRASRPEDAGAPAPTALAESLYAHAARLGPALSAAASDSAKVDLLRDFVFDSLALAPAESDTSLAASVPSLVLERRSGSCVGLVLYILALGETLELPLHPVFLPGHLAVRFRSPAHVRTLETLRRGIARSDSFYVEAFSLGKRPWYRLADSRPEQALGALVFNLANHHRLRGEWAAAEWEYRLAEEVLPGFPEALGNRGAGLLAAGDPAGARPLLEAALAGDSLAEPARRNLVTIGGAGNSSQDAGNAVPVSDR